MLNDEKLNDEKTILEPEVSFVGETNSEEINVNKSEKTQTRLDFVSNLEKINKELEIKMSELVTSQKSLSEKMQEFDEKRVKSNFLLQKLLNFKLRREVKLNEVRLVKLKNDVAILDSNVKRLQNERTKIREMIELKNVTSSAKDFNLK